MEGHKNYPAFVDGLFKDSGALRDDITHAALGIGGEAGEVVDLVKKSVAYNQLLDREKVVKELGDLFFYMQAMMNRLGIPFDEVLMTNMAKLKARYPNGYSDQAAIERRDMASGDCI